ncbi:SET domain-containing protein-lysine N-methyltransferase [Lacibacter luteus]|uniref:SET domain-containing protein-lysine N-methyltransferase n=1 Tax=Lacibacter luteus TaxID=2508719 RepID=A0A4V1M809_9BACT|nr:SET domain-containing protein-lysine N-methyltransferase [Lacibacter luteus]RXK62212.1 SET domain-containing protein-lysine N-methyltransferase [Lacibacter luteus]
MSVTTLSATVLSGHYGFAEIHKLPDVNHHLLVSTKSFQPEETICTFGAKEIHAAPSRFTVQVNETQHIILQPEFLQYINHSCNPNAFFNTTTMELIALRAIVPGDEFTFFYPSTEWFMAEPFACRCGEANCIGTIKGAKELTKDVLKDYRLTDFIQRKVQQRND